MVNPVRGVAKQFVRRSRMTFLIFGIIISLIDFFVLYVTAAKEGVLHINQGIGLFNNYGLFSTIIGNAVFLYAAKKYYDDVCSMRTSKAIVNTAPIEESLSTLNDMIQMLGKYQFPIYLLIVLGALFW